MAKESIPFRNGVLGNKPKNSYQRFASTNACSDLFTFYLHFTILRKDILNFRTRPKVLISSHHNGLSKVVYYFGCKLRMYDANFTLISKLLLTKTSFVSSHTKRNQCNINYLVFFYPDNAI